MTQLVTVWLLFIPGFADRLPVFREFDTKESCELVAKMQNDHSSRQKAQCIDIKRRL